MWRRLLREVRGRVREPQGNQWCQVIVQKKFFLRVQSSGTVMGVGSNTVKVQSMAHTIWRSDLFGWKKDISWRGLAQLYVDCVFLFWHPQSPRSITTNPPSWPLCEDRHIINLLYWAAWQISRSMVEGSLHIWAPRVYAVCTCHQFWISDICYLQRLTFADHGSWCHQLEPKATRCLAIHNLVKQVVWYCLFAN